MPFTFRQSLCLYIVLFLALTFPYWMKGEVVAPHRNTVELAASDIEGEKHLENRKFTDYSNAYIPSLSQHLSGKRSAWLTLWSNQNELGKPLEQLAGFYPIYAPTWLLSCFTQNPGRLFTILSLTLCFLAGLFMMLFCRELKLSPLAGMLAGGALAASPYMMYWLTFPMFLSILCWSTGALYSVTRLARKQDLISWSIFAFSIYSLLMTAYPQGVVYHAYILSGYGVYMTYRHWQTHGSASTIRFLALVGTAAGIGVGLTLPTYLDLAYNTSESGRAAPDLSFYLDALVNLTVFFKSRHVIMLTLFPELAGNFVSQSYPFIYDGFSITSLTALLAFSGTILCWRRIWGWWIPIFVLVPLTFILPCFIFILPCFIFCIKYLGLSLSRSIPLGNILLPLTILAAYGADALIRSSSALHKKTVLFATAAVTGGLLGAVIFCIRQGLPFSKSAIIFTLAILALFASQYTKSRPLFLVVALILSGAFISFPLMLRQDPTHIAKTSPLVEKVRQNLPPDSRYAIASPGLAVLPPNFNASLNLPSVHSYNSLSSKRYHALIAALGGEVIICGRWNGFITPDYASPVFWMSNISLMLSPTKLVHPNLSYVGQEGGVYLHRVLSRMEKCLQIENIQDPLTEENIQIDDPRKLTKSQPHKTLDQGDLIEFTLNKLSPLPSLLLLSQKFHRDWKAKVWTPASWTSAKTIPVNGIFQGVLLPPEAQKVQLQFLPFVRYAWIVHIFWLLLLLAIGIQFVLCMRKKS